MGKHVEIKKVVIDELEKPVLYNEKLYKYHVLIQYENSNRCESKFPTINECLNFISSNSTQYSPSWEEVTCNGKYSCD